MKQELKILFGTLEAVWANLSQFRSDEPNWHLAREQLKEAIDLARKLRDDA